ncbi:uncharacterized protein LOC127282798 [Leptopilina boulardi]|uniref:uncharacterized protein LOC127282798 n=1 Tax=Leptopilina boulardi TaxID=63433 RepID=UPI0021F68C45|nr:uncharacterized protein LOC127282798 [Leptopilina boulardi]XP_051163251.1 uncharacterized protein LOC127282798 [Leptopilina boulardi]XP_051163252.1 uncharacterized protein LOC127282798 [Leptopilina boulardi]XP_051163253.1 uncharacterized protein LOC127282798 [Leptopilina boulardi]XP_051163254.1 uncharacterized protein LOC127282798 [Leptopilina boulardi]XP_051163255.1 uncharacterized protein LOC127282798 [Leptopilina boulardi]XP_051163257.1 uncharacterized protein LOC127282798 [Leptopilina 
MNISIIIFLSLFGLIVTEKLEKIQGTAGEFSDIIADNNKRWYIIRDRKLYYSLDKGKTLNKIQLPSEELVHKGMGIDQFDNIYIQDDKLSVFIVAPSIHETFVIEKLELEHKNERLISRPFALGDNLVYLATKNGPMELENSALRAKKMEIPPRVKKEISQFIRFNITERYGDSFEEIFYTVNGDKRHWIYVISSGTAVPLCQTKGHVKRLNVIGNRVYFTVNYDNSVNIIEYREKPKFIPEYHKEITYPSKLEGIENIYIDDNSDFVIFSRVNNYKTFIYGNVDNNNSGIVYGLDTFLKDGKNLTEIVSSNKLDNIRILCGVIENDKLYFGTSDGIYELKDI